MLIISNLAFLTMSKKVRIWYLTFSATYSPKSSSRRKSFWFYSRRREGNLVYLAFVKAATSRVMNNIHLHQFAT